MAAEANQRSAVPTVNRTIAIVLGSWLTLMTLAAPSEARAGDSPVSTIFTTPHETDGKILFGELISLTGSDSAPISKSPNFGGSDESQSPPRLDEAVDVSPVIETTDYRQTRFIDDSPSRWHVLPSDTLFHSFIAGVHAPRMGGEMVNDDDLGMLLDTSIGGRMPLVRYGTVGPEAEGVGLQIYGAALTRLAMDRASDVVAADYKFGVPLVFKFGSTSHQIGYDHLSSHVGDEYLVRYPDFQRRNYVRDAIRYAIVQDLTEDFAVYADINRAFHTSGGAGGWHFQFGAEYEPYVPAGFRGAPVAAINTELREEFDYEGSLGLVLGWQWRGMDNDNLLRLGLSVYSGHSRQYSFYEQYENLVGAGLWYDF